MFESVFDYDKENHIFPCVSIAVIIDSLGDTEFNVALLWPPFSPHTFRMKLVSLIHVSSIFIMRFFSLNRESIFKAYCYLYTMHLSELA